MRREGEVRTQIRSKDSVNQARCTQKELATCNGVTEKKTSCAITNNNCCVLRRLHSNEATCEEMGRRWGSGGRETERRGREPAKGGAAE